MEQCSPNGSIPGELVHRKTYAAERTVCNWFGICEKKKIYVQDRNQTIQRSERRGGEGQMQPMLKEKGKKKSEHMWF